MLPALDAVTDFVEVGLLTMPTVTASLGENPSALTDTASPA